MEPFRGKASGKTWEELIVEQARRIADLEAELDQRTAQLVGRDAMYGAQMQEFKERAEKAEAEVEGLKSFIRRIADTPERSATAERLFEALERVE